MQRSPRMTVWYKAGQHGWTADLVLIYSVGREEVGGRWSGDGISTEKWSRSQTSDGVSGSF